jgi:MFS family permease
MKIKNIEVTGIQIGILVIVWLAFLLSFIGRLAWPPIMPLAVKDLALTAKEAGSYMTAFYIGYVLTQLPGGLLTDRFGYRKVILGSFIIMGFATALMGTAQTYEQGFIYRILAGVGSGAVYSACIRAIFEWFPDKGRGTAMGFFFTASSLGLTVVNLFVPTIAGFYSWKASFFVAGGFSIIALIFAFFILKERKNLLERKQAQEIASFLGDIKILLRNRNLMIAACSGFCAMWATWGTATWANTYMNKGLHLSLVEAGFIMSLYGIAALICKPIAGILTDVFGQKKKLLIFWMIIVFAPLLLLFGINTNITLLYILAPLLGIAAFLYMPVLSVYVGELVEIRLIGSATGLVNTIWQLGSLLSPLVVGMVLDGTKNYAFAFAALAAGPIIGALVILTVKPEKIAQKLIITTFEVRNKA